jgi:endoglucanase
MKSKLKKDLINLTDMITVSGSEQDAIRYLKPLLEAACDTVEVTHTGNLIATKIGAKRGPRVILSAHMDEIGFAVKFITPEGFIKFEKVGDFSDKMMPARPVWVQTETGRIPGIIGMRAGHLLSPEEARTAQSARQLYIDIGVSSAQEARQLGVFIGAKIAFRSELTEMSNPDMVYGRNIDDKIGCAIALNIAETLKKEDFAGELIAVFSTLEEVTVAGMFPMYERLKADYAIVLDTVPCGDVPDIDTENELPVYAGRGPVMIVSQGDPSVLRYSNIHPGVRKLFNRVSEKSGIRLQELVLSENAYLTEESLSFAGGCGTPAATLGIPRRYSHTPTELLNMNDAAAAYDFLMELFKLNETVTLSFV